MLRSEKATGRCQYGFHDDPDNTGQCVRCRVVLDPVDAEEKKEVEVREAREEMNLHALEGHCG